MDYHLQVIRIAMVLAAAFAPLVESPARANAAVAKAPVSPDEFFEPTRLWTIHLGVSADRWKMMHPTRRSPLVAILGGKPATRPAANPDDPLAREGRRTEANPFGYEYAYVRGRFELEGRAYTEVGLRFKGNSSYMSAGRGFKRPFKIDFNRFIEGQEFVGLTKLNLHNNALDPSQMREALSYEFFRDVGVAAPRTTYALVYLTIEGRSERECLGLYTVIEEVNKDFLKSRFDTRKGLLLKPELRGDLPHHGEKWEAYEGHYLPKSEATAQTSQRVIELTRLIHKADDEEFGRRIGEYLDTDAFLRFVAANALLSNLDSFLTTAHNFYLYVHPETLRVQLMPWDVNLSFGAFSWVGSPREQADLSIDRPHTNPNRLTSRLLADPAVSGRYREIVGEMMERSFTAEKLHARIDAHQAVIEEAERRIRAEGRKPTTAPTRRMAEDAPQLKPFVSARIESVRRQLEGKSQGYQPVWQMKRVLGFAERNAGPPATQPQP